MRALLSSVGTRGDVQPIVALGCDVVLGGNAHQYAARSLAELRGVPYVTALYAPVAIPSPDHAPPGPGWQPGDAATNTQKWDEARRAWNARALERVNVNRAKRGLAPVDDVLGFNVTGAPWLATDPLLAPVPAMPGGTVFATGAWTSTTRRRSRPSSLRSSMPARRPSTSVSAA